MRQPGGGPVVRVERAGGGSAVRWSAASSRLRPPHAPTCARGAVELSARVDRRARPEARPHVCGYRFRPQDDRFAWRGRLGWARGFAEILCFVSLQLIRRAYAGCTPAGSLSLSSRWRIDVHCLLLPRPHRTIPTDPDLLVSPRRRRRHARRWIEAPDFPGGRALRVSISCPSSTSTSTARRAQGLSRKFATSPRVPHPAPRVFRPQRDTVDRHGR